MTVICVAGVMLLRLATLALLPERPVEDDGARGTHTPAPSAEVAMDSTPSGLPGSMADGSEADYMGPRQDAMFTVLRDTLKRNDSIYQSLGRQQVCRAQIASLNGALNEVFDTRRHVRPGDWYELILDNGGAVQRFHYVPGRTPEQPILVERRQERLQARRLDLPLTRVVLGAEVRIQDNLSAAIARIGEGDALTDLLADGIFGAVIDFRRDPRQGDIIQLLYEKLYRDDQFVRYGHVLMARYQGQVVSQTGIRFTDTAGNCGYYDADGQSLKRQFLLYPLPFRGITSRFNHQRHHPILNRVVPHLGTDYAASTGTPVWATGRGQVIHAGWRGALGKAVFIRHPNGYETRYGHLSRILVTKGQQVQQKQEIGRVGATGRATGPHLHFEIIKDGRHLNPETINRGKRGEPLPPELLTAFHTRRDELRRRLEAETTTPATLATAADTESLQPQP